jgi:hypothetical protein
MWSIYLGGRCLFSCCTILFSSFFPSGDFWLLGTSDLTHLKNLKIIFISLNFGVVVLMLCHYSSYAKLLCEQVWPITTNWNWTSLLVIFLMIFISCSQTIDVKLRNVNKWKIHSSLSPFKSGITHHYDEIISQNLLVVTNYCIDV